MTRAHLHIQTPPALAGTGVARVRGDRAQDEKSFALRSASTPAWPMPSNAPRIPQ